MPADRQAHRRPGRPGNYRTAGAIFVGTCACIAGNDPRKDEAPALYRRNAGGRIVYFLIADKHFGQYQDRLDAPGGISKAAHVPTLVDAVAEVPPFSKQCVSFNPSRPQST